MKKEFIVVAVVIVCIIGLFVGLSSISEETIVDDFNYNATFLNLKHFPVMLMNNTSGEQTIVSHSDYVGTVHD